MGQCKTFFETDMQFDINQGIRLDIDDKTIFKKLSETSRDEYS
jgi:hypothetical protein